jgi:RimJ/RimL family protein N-acetyltransferase
MSDYPIETARLKLRRWREEDRAPFAAMNADAEVMEHFPTVMTREQSDASYERIQKHFARRGFGVWAVEAEGEFAGFTGLMHPGFEAHFTPCVEAGWRLARRFWGKGIATEAARMAVRYGFEQLLLDEIVSFTIPANARSRRVMEKIGMRHSGDFDHPALAEGHPMRRHVLYRLSRSKWLEMSQPPP